MSLPLCRRSDELCFGRPRKTILRLGWYAALLESHGEVPAQAAPVFGLRPKDF